jgi:uncharacterized membrane protein
MSSTASLVAKMAQALAGAGVDLGDERACMRALKAANFKYSEIVLYGDRDARAASQNILIIDGLEEKHPARGYSTAHASADIVIRNGVVVKDRDGVFDGVSA